MARYIKDVNIDQPIDVVSIVIEDFLYHNHFTRSDWNGEMVYSGKDSRGKQRFFKYTYVNSILHVEAWMKGAFGGETSIATGGGSKADYRESIERLLSRLRVHSGNVQIGDYVGHDPMNHGTAQPAYRQPAATPAQSVYKQPAATPAQPVYKQQNTYTTPKSVYTSSSMPTQRTSAGGSALILSLVAVFFGLMVPLFGLIMGVIAKKRLEQEDVDDRHRKLVKTLSTLAIVFSIISFIVSFILPFVFAANTFFSFY